MRKKIKEEAAPTLSDAAKEAVSWLFDDAPDGMPVTDAKQFIVNKWGQETEDEIKDFFNIL